MTKSKRQGCSCERCKECCTREAGWFMPEEIAAAASFVGMSEDDFVREHCEEHIESNTIVISPKTKPGKTECIFLDREGMCRIHEVKPYECRKVFACEAEYRHQNIREKIKKQWRK